MTNLSPAAQAVLDAYKSALLGEQYAASGRIEVVIAAALRAAAIYSYCPVDRQRLFTIAAELEDANG